MQKRRLCWPFVGFMALMILGRVGAAEACQLPQNRGIAPDSPKPAQHSQPGDPTPTFSEQVTQVMFPYQQGPPSVPHVIPGTALTRGNWQLAEGLLAPEILSAVRDGVFTILIQPTNNLPVSPAYIQATLEHADRVRLDEAGQLQDYQAGLPFPVLDKADTQAGLKAAWNARHADRGRSLKRWEAFQVRDEGGQHQHGFSVIYSRAYGMHNAKPEDDIADWKAEGILLKEFMEVLYPSPSLTIHPHLGPVHLWAWYDQDTRSVGQWYLPKYTTLHRLQMLPYNPEASAWRFPILFEDLMGTYVSAFRWHLLCAKTALVPGFVHGTEPLFGGGIAGYPLDPWELRTVYMVEAVPRHDKHPYGRKVFVFDQQTFAPLYILTYDQAGQLWRIGFSVYAHPEAYPWSEDVRVPILIGRSWIDVRAKVVMLALVEEARYGAPLSPDFFSLANLLRKAQ